MDPNNIPPSPTRSALLRLSDNVEIPSPTETDDRSTIIAPRSPQAPVPPIESIPDIPDHSSSIHPKTGSGNQSQASILPKKSIVQLAEDVASQKTSKKSKLSALASSRSIVSSLSRSSRSYTIDSDASDVTYPILRPSPSSTFSSVTTDDGSSTTTRPSTMTRFVNEAVQTALRLEELDRAKAQEPPKQEPRSVLSVASSSRREARPASSLSSTPKTPQRPAAPIPESSPEDLPPQVPTSPAVQASAIHAPAGQAPTARGPAVQTTTLQATAGQPRQPSKLAMLAQAKAAESHWLPKPKKPASSGPGLAIHKTYTEYLTPIANGPTATTAITTTYQSLGSLMSHNKSALPPSVITPTSPKAKTPSSAEGRQSKLTMKSKKGNKKADPEPEPSVEEISQVLEMPIFSPEVIRARASPSAFASVLVDDANTVDRKGKGRAIEEQDEDSARDKTKRRSRRNKNTPAPFTSPLSRGFAFDVPSPDDIVFNARKGSSLAQRPLASTSN